MSSQLVEEIQKEKKSSFIILFLHLFLNAFFQQSLRSSRLHTRGDFQIGRCRGTNNKQLKFPIL